MSASPPVLREVRDQRYVASGSGAHLVDVLVPCGCDRAPLVVFIHGGAWRDGSRAQFDSPEGPGFVALRDVLLGRGWATASIDYRLTGEASMPAQMHDVKAAVRWLRSESDRLGVDGSRIAVVGESAGGHLAQWLGVTRGMPAHEGDLGVRVGTTSGVAAVVSYYGVSDLGGIVPDRVATGCGRGEAGRLSPEGLLVGHDPESTAGSLLARQASPLTFVSASSAPTLFVHGLQDCVVPHLQSERAHAAMQAVGVESELVLVDGGHAEPHFYTDEDVCTQVIAFLTRHLAG